MRIEGGRRHVDSAGADYWIHRLNGAPALLPDEPALTFGPASTRAAAEILTRVYGDLLARLTLSAAHRGNLRQRGLTDAEIDRRGYRTLPARGRSRLAGELVDRFGAAVCRGVPGLYVHEEARRSWWSLAGRGGLLIPVRDLAARVLALKVRADVPAANDERYSYLSSRRYGGAGPGAPPHVPLSGGDVETVRLTEGELKADVATSLAAMLCIAVPGVSCYRSALPVLQKLGTQTVNLAFDADFRGNPHVARALECAARFLAESGFRVILETWELAAAKGLDDLLHTGKQPRREAFGRPAGVPLPAPQRPIGVPLPPAARPESIALPPPVRPVGVRLPEARRPNSVPLSERGPQR